MNFWQRKYIIIRDKINKLKENIKMDMEENKETQKRKKLSLTLSYFTKEENKIKYTAPC